MYTWPYFTRRESLHWDIYTRLKWLRFSLCWKNRCVSRQHIEYILIKRLTKGRGAESHYSWCFPGTRLKRKRERSDTRCAGNSKSRYKKPSFHFAANLKVPQFTDCSCWDYLRALAVTFTQNRLNTRIKKTFLERSQLKRT